MKQKPSQRIGNAIIERLFGPQSWLLANIHPLSKSPCSMCGAYVMQKDKESHAATHEKELATFALTEADINDMYDTYEWSEHEQYRAAH